MLDKNAKIYVAGHRGLVGSAIWKNLEEKGYTNLIGKTHTELDLLDGVAVRRFFDEEQPEYVFLAAAFVGGIMANRTGRRRYRRHRFLLRVESGAARESVGVARPGTRKESHRLLRSQFPFFPQGRSYKAGADHH